MDETASSSPSADELLALISKLAAELHPGQKPPSLSLDSSLADDAGLDSLGRVELMLRLQRDYAMQVTEQTAISAETPRELLAAMGPAGATASQAAPSANGSAQPRPDADALAPPEDAATLMDILDQRADTAPNATHLVLVGHAGEADQRLSYAEVRQGAAATGAGLRYHGLAPGDRVAVMLPTGADFFYAFHGVLRAGGVPVPLYPPVRASQIEGHARRLAAVLTNAGTRIFVASKETRAVGRILQALVPDLTVVATVDELRASAEPIETVPRAAEDLAFLQYTSGTTGDPKGVMLTHANLLANIRAMGPTVGAGPHDRFVSWLPLYHDMGLIGACLTTLYFGIEVVLMSPLQFMGRPERWLWAIHAYGGTISAGPNFAYDLCAARIDDAALEGLDLSGWRLAFNGAEAVSPRTLERFAARFADYGFNERALMPVYGLAESSVGLAFPPVGRGPRVDRIERNALETGGRAEPVPADADDVLRFAACGHVLAGHELRIVDDTGEVAGERHEGRIQFRGPSCTAGYFGNEAATAALFTCDGWLESGDRGYLADGEIFVTGRIKDLIIRAGRNIHPEAIEAAVATVDGIRKNNVAAFASGTDAHGERLVVLAETRETDPERLEGLRSAASRAAAEVVDGGPSAVVLVGPGTLPKTSSGKIRRSGCRALYERGATGGSSRPTAQVLRLVLASVVPVLRRAPTHLARAGFGLWCWLVGLVIGLPGAVLVVATPGRGLRASLSRGVARLVLALTATSPRISGPVDRAADPTVVVANHASYLDGLVLRAALPGRLFFVAKRELARFSSARVFLERIGVEFVDRQHHERGLADFERIRNRARAGETPVSFPEGVLYDGPGLRGFRVGAFMVATQTAIPVLPVALRGTRQLLPNRSLLPSPARLELIAGEPLAPSGEDWDAALELRDRARRFILEHCNEPDLAAGKTHVVGNL